MYNHSFHKSFWVSTNVQAISDAETIKVSKNSYDLLPCGALDINHIITFLNIFKHHSIAV